MGEGSGSRALKLLLLNVTDSVTVLVGQGGGFGRERTRPGRQCSAGFTIATGNWLELQYRSATSQVTLG